MTGRILCRVINERQQLGSAKLGTEIKLLGGNGGGNVTILIIFSIDLKIGRKESYDSEGNDSSSMEMDGMGNH